MQLAVRITLATTSPVPAYTGGPFSSGVAQMDTGGGTGWNAQYLVSCGSLGERVDIATGGNYGQLLDTQVAMANFDLWYAAFQAAGASLNGALVEVGEWLSSIAITPRWTGNIVDASFEGANIELRVENVLGTRHKLVPARTISSAEFPGINPTDEGRPVPIVVGSVENIVAPNISPTVSDVDAFWFSYNAQWVARSEAFAISATASTIRVPAYIFPTAGPTPSGSLNDNLWYNLVPTSVVYIEITAGTGAGQRRLCASRVISLNISGDCTIYGGDITVSVDWEAIPDTTSLVTFTRLDTSYSLAFADEGTASQVTTNVNGIEYPIGFVARTASGINYADISDEFRNGENFKALEYTPPPYVYGLSGANDLKSVTAGDAVVSAKYRTEAYDTATGINAFRDVLLPFRYTATELPALAVENNSDVYFLASIDDPADIVNYVVQFVVIDIFGNRYEVGYGDFFPSGPTAALFPVSNASTINAYSPSITTDGIAGRFSSQAYKITMPVRLSYVKEIYGGLISRRSPVTIYSCQSIQGVNTAGSVSITGVLFPPTSPPVAGDYLIPAKQSATNYIAATISTFSRSGNVGDYPSYADGILMDGNLYRRIQSVTGSYPGVGSIVLDTAYADAYNGFYLVVPAAQMGAFTANEVGIAFSFGDITPASGFNVDASSGRKFSAAWPALPSGKSIGDPITLARDAVLDMYYRDLALGAASVDFASFQALPADPIHSALVSRVDSAQRVADLCQEFNWVVGHAADGKETAYAWLSRVGTTTYDLSIDTGDIVEGSLTGIALSDIQDLCNLPNFQWDWTQADGFRQSCNVIDVKADPTTLTSANYLQYLTGFGDFGMSLAVYQALHASYQLSNYQRSATFELPDVGTDPGGVLWPLVGMSRFDWMASRKPIFKMLIPDTSAASAAIVGQRVRLRHKRYTAGAWVYGTVVEWELDPMSAEYSIVVMGDPSALPTTGAGLYIDTLDPTATVPQYIDVRDGVTTQYIDHLGA